MSGPAGATQPESNAASSSSRSSGPTSGGDSQTFQAGEPVDTLIVTVPVCQCHPTVRKQDRPNRPGWHNVTAAHQVRKRGAV